MFDRGGGRFDPSGMPWDDHDYGEPDSEPSYSRSFEPSSETNTPEETKVESQPLEPLAYYIGLLFWVLALVIPFYIGIAVVKLHIVWTILMTIFVGYPLIMLVSSFVVIDPLDKYLKRKKKITS
ncbi:hypothetical protein A2962_01980 [Candidatus Woesebacteria bacterium RIFCSPLOWO2_01_FULL_39_61]|uniref:Uncharacterized protein n=1 Tax=Candidatus Woesebacteria bacterium RIFCSPHIGHO2_02_FULL_39_13 TaxID=1802505 RepID=A0A1F7Z2Y4_9BACT|nr:MAG: hypothetical protein A2692_02700 [Candidatus Woesebacteria bacterium RIFCSPHIGHO2_01_FULL_39_95]OGM33278.1 MAG: hypothetical protein A3D01_00620 [Candidatus Woesebacteria bacterium RIFCSPHIGHO2_02_FULL_39_13]OGM38450.1 MAG: hypothetical protein A3E13_00500 [Candidatus Woesebacteria bacterium RIFCSPHIGHO2_12_FULL_40_20]OGM66888.1 MAG: hypothetical protein A2962_01980 [Candidatus Woesebacteria bacterium RIFCSPLOWO2_01_FULL_39_61]OGM75327.1 MAG: hypothetical protein A3H19_02880 [Candidatus